MSDKRVERYTAIDTIRSKGFYQNLLVQPFDVKISADFKKFPNQLLNQIVSSLDYVDNMKDLIQVMNVSDYAHIFVEFNNTYDECQRHYEYWFQAQQQEYERLLQQQQAIYQNQLSYGTQNQFGNQGGFNQYNQQGYQNTQYPYQNYPTQNYPSQNYPNQNQNFNQNQNQNYGNNYHNKGQGHYNQNFEQGQRHHYNKQHDNYNNGQRTYNQNHQGKYGNNYNQKDQNQYGNNQNHNNRKHQYGNSGEGTGYRKNNYQNYNNIASQFQQISHIPPVPVQQIKKIVEVPKPQKPELKPVKFTLSQLKGLINSFNDKENQNVNKNLIAKVQEVKSWKQGEVSFDQKLERPPFKKEQSKREGGYNNNNQGKFDKGKNYTPTPEQPDGPKKDGLSIVIGKNQTLETKLIKQEIKGKAGQDFATIMEQQQSSLSDLDKAKKQIVYNLNLLAPENIKDIQRDLTPFLFENKQICEILVQQIIGKAWDQPKYASTYAKLCQSFSKTPQTSFKFQEVKQGKTQKNNPFKRFLISTVQHSFDKKVQKLPQFKDNEEQQNYLKQAKKKILGNMKFIAELIRSKILKKQIMKICITQLISAFLSKYENFKKTGKIQDSYYDYYFEALIQFSENVGDFFEKMDKSNGSYQVAQKVILDICEQKVPPKEQISQISDLTSDQYFKIFAILDSKIIRKINSRLSALLQNLEQRRANGWVKHHAEGQGPKKLKDIKEDIAKQEEQMNRVKSSKKASLQHLNELVKVMFKDWENVAKNQRIQIKKILKEFSQLQFFSAFLSQVADQKKQNVAKRVQLFDFVLDEFFNESIFKNAWLDTIKNLAFSSSDFPFCGAALAKILIKLKDKKKFNLADYYLKTTDQDEQYFMNEVYDKLYHYTNWEQIKQFTEPSKKVSGML